MSYDYDVAKDNEPKYVTIPRAQHEALMAAKDELVRLHKLTGYVETEDTLAALRAAGIETEG